jgi:hypothetical protein
MSILDAPGLTNSQLKSATSAVLSQVPHSFKPNFSVAGDGALRVSSEDSAPAFSCCTGLFTPASTPQDIAGFILSSYTRSASLKSISVSGVSTSGGVIAVRIQKSANGGFPASGFTNPFIARRDQNDTSPSVTVYAFTANRTSNGSGVSSTRSIIDEQDITLGVVGSSAGSVATFNFVSGGCKCPTLKQLSDMVVVNLNGQTMPAGTQIRVTFNWQEQRTVRIGAVGDSTTALATSGYMNNGSNNGGMGQSGLLNSIATIDNLGSNGYRLFDFLQGTNGVTYSALAAQGQSYDIWNFCYGINDVRLGSIGSDAESATNQLTSMIDAAIYSALSGTVSGQTYISPKATRYAISGIAWASSIATVTTSTPHGFQSVGTVNVNISGCAPSGYNGTYAITVTGANTFTYSLASNPGTLTAGGSGGFATTWATTNKALPDLKIILWGPNCFSSDDGGDGPFYYMSVSGNTTLSGIWTGLTLAQAAQSASTILYNAYAAFVGDTRIFALLQKQDVFGKTVQTVAALGLLQNQLHPNSRGQILGSRQILPSMIAAINTVQPYIY